MSLLPARSTLLLAFLLWALAAFARAEEVVELRGLSFAEAQAGRRVTITGVAGYVRDIPSDFNFSVHDTTGGVMVYPKERYSVRPGQHVSVTGSTAMSVHGLRLVDAVVRVGEPEALPQPLMVTMADIREGQHEGQFVEVAGLIRAVRLESPVVLPQRLALDFGPRSRRLTVWVSTYPGGLHQFTPGQRVRCRGVVIRWRNPRGQAQSVNVLANHESDITSLAPAGTAPLLSIADGQHWNDPDEQALPMRVAGVVTLVEPPTGLLVLQQGTQAIRIRPAEGSATATVGQAVEATGFPMLGHYTAELEDAILQPKESTANIEPETFSNAASLLSAEALLDHDARLIRLPAIVLTTRHSETHQLIDCSSGSYRFTASLPQSSPLTATVRPDSRVELTGICSLLLTEDRRRLGRGPDAFTLQLRQANDIRVLAAGPWWTPQRLWQALGLVGLLSALLVLWAVSLGGKNKRLREAMLAQEQAEQALNHERRRVSDQLHDTLQQTLTAASLQLHAAARLMPQQAEDAATAVAMAQELTKRGQDEVKAAVWDLRMDEQAVVCLGDLLRRLIHEMQGQADTTLSYSEDAALNLPAHQATQIVRIAREALTNAAKHAHATIITASVLHTDTSWTLSIHDNGVGFDAHAMQGPVDGHFGLSNMQERAAHLGAMLHIESQPSKGTLIQLSMPS